MFAVLIHWWVEVLHADRTTYMCIWTATEPWARLLQRKTGLSPPVIYYWPLQCDASVVVHSKCQCSSAFCLSLTYCSIYLGKPCGHLLGKSCPLGFSLVLFWFYCRLNCRCPFPVWCLGQDMEFDLSVPDHCLFIYFLWRWLTRRSTEKRSFRWNVWKLLVCWRSMRLFLNISV